MKVIAFHPEDLIDRAFQGTLTSDEQVRLDAHLEQCPTCRLEHQLRADFAAQDQREEPSAALHALVSGALLAAQPAAARPVRGRAWWMVAVAVLLLMSGMAAAQIELVAEAVDFVQASTRELIASARGERTPSRVARARVDTSKLPARVAAPVPADLNAAKGEPMAAPQEVAPHPVPAARGDIVNTAPRAKSVALAPRAVPAASAPQVAAAPQVASSQVASSQTVSAQVASSQTAPAQAVHTQEVATAPEPTSAAAEPAPVDPAVVLFAHANRLRRQGDVTAASPLYRELGARFSHTPEGKLSLALLARIELDRHEAHRALADFDAYLATGDRTLREQALAGRALALGELSDRTAECAAYDVLLGAYPTSAYELLARRRCGPSE